MSSKIFCRQKEWWIHNISQQYTTKLFENLGVPTKQHDIFILRNSRRSNVELSMTEWLMRDIRSSAQQVGTLGQTNYFVSNQQTELNERDKISTKKKKTHTTPKKETHLLPKQPQPSPSSIIKMNEIMVISFPRNRLSIFAKLRPMLHSNKSNEIDCND